MSATNRGGKAGRDKSTKNTHNLQNGKTDTAVAGVKHQVKLPHVFLTVYFNKQLDLCLAVIYS
jgi:hypothetical protein